MPNHPFIIRKGTRDDLPSVLRLIRELALFEKAPEEVTNSLEAMERDGFGQNPVFGFHVAEENNVIVGMALYFVKYSTWKGKGLYLDDLIVTESCRGRGIGRALFDAFMMEAKMIKANQVHWQVLDWNEPAIEFYRKMNASIDATWLDCKMSRSQIESYNS
jgi:GNAT superfamily N-acetyltransferase